MKKNYFLLMFALIGFAGFGQTETFPNCINYYLLDGYSEVCALRIQEFSQESTLYALGVDDDNEVTRFTVPAPLNQKATAYSAGTVYNLTTTMQKVDFGTTDPSITLPSAGTYVILANLRLDYTGLTNTLVNTCSFKLRRTNNTAADLSDATTAFSVPPVTLLTGTGGDADISPVFYTTATSGDVIEMQGSRGSGLSLGNIQVGQASILAYRIY